MASHIYWRVLFTKPPGAAKARSISRLQMHPIVNGINLCVTGNGQISARTEAPPKKNDTFVAYNAVSNNPLADWMSEKISDFDWIKWTFNTPREILEIQLTASRDRKRVKNAPQDFQLQWSDDDIEWNTVFIVLGELHWGPGEARRFSYEILTTTIGQAYTKALALPATPFTDHLVAGEHDTASALTTHRNKTVSLAPAESSEVVHPIRAKGPWYIPLNSAPELDTPGTMTVKVTVVLIEPTLEPSGAISLVVKRSRPLSLIQANEEDTARSITNIITVPIGQAAETEVAHSISRGTINIALGGAASYNEASPFSADKQPQFSGVVSLHDALGLKYARRIALQKAVESDTTLVSATIRVVQLGVAAESDESLSSHISRAFSLGTAAGDNSALPFSIEQGRILPQTAEKDFGLSIRGSRSFPYSQAEGLSSAYALGYSTGVSLGQAVDTSSAGSFAEPRSISLGIAGEKDARISMFRCPIFEKDHAYSVVRGFPDVIQSAREADTSAGSRPEKIGPLGQSFEEDVSSGSKYVIVAVLGQAAEYNSTLYSEITAGKNASVNQAIVQSSALPVNEVKSNTVGPSAERALALRVFPPFSGILGIGGEGEETPSLSSLKTQELLQVSEQDTSLAIDRNYSRELGTALEDDIARLYDHFNVVRLGLINAPSSGIPIDPLRTVVLGQAASKNESGGVERDRDIQVRLARTKGEAFPVYIHVADQFNQAVETEVGLYVNAVKSKALQLAAEDNSVHVLTKILKARGFNIGTEEDTALAVRTAFAHDFNPSAEKNTAGSMSALKTAILRYADDGEFAYALDKFLKVQGLNPAPELDVALIPTANLSKELKKAFEYDEALRNDVARVKFLRQVATNEVSYALGQSLKRVLIKQAVSTAQGVPLYDTGARRNTWYTMLPMHRELQFELEIDREAPFEAQVAREAVFRTEI